MQGDLVERVGREGLALNCKANYTRLSDFLALYSMTAGWIEGFLHISNSPRAHVNAV